MARITNMAPANKCCCPSTAGLSLSGWRFQSARYRQQNISAQQGVFIA